MIIVTIFEAEGEQHFNVHAHDNDGNTTDVTSQYELHSMCVEEGEDVVAGWHFGKRLKKAEVIKAED